VWITPLAADPVPLYSQTVKQQWNNAPIFQGGGLIILGAGAVTGTGQVGIGLEVGSRTDLGVGRTMSRYRLGNVAVNGFVSGLLLNSYNHYLGSFENLHLELNTYNLAFGTAGVSSANSGENFEFHKCLLAGASSAVFVNVPGWDASFVNCSFDYCDRVATITHGYGNLSFIGGHIEGITPQGTAPGYGTDAGGMIVCTAVDGDANVSFDRTTTLVQAQNPIIRGANLTVSGSLLLRPAGDTMTAAGAVSVDPTVPVADLQNLARVNRRIVTDAHNRLPDPKFLAETLGTAVATLKNWVVSGSGYTLDVIAGGYAGGQALRVTLTTTSYIILTAKNPLGPIRSIYERHATAIINTNTLGANCTMAAAWTQPDGTTPSTAAVALGTTALPAGSFQAPQTLTNVAPNQNLAVASAVTPQFVVSNPTGGTIVVIVGYVYFGQ
jgi:hypothetical protein